MVILLASFLRLRKCWGFEVVLSSLGVGTEVIPLTEPVCKSKDNPWSFDDVVSKTAKQSSKPTTTCECLQIKLHKHKPILNSMSKNNIKAVSLPLFQK